jgi:hypothetical protein
VFDQEIARGRIGRVGGGIFDPGSRDLEVGVGDACRTDLLLGRDEP